MNGIEITRFLEQKYPKENAYEYDNVGLQVGSLNSRVRKVLITLDVTKEVVKEAISLKVDLIISHHPLLFNPLTNLSIETPRGWVINHLIKQKISLYSMHTNFDCSEEGMNDAFAKMLGLTEISLLDEMMNIGRIGTIEEVSFDDFVSRLKNDFEIPNILLIGHKKETIKKVAFSLGSGARHIPPAKRKNADVYLTGDVTYHQALDAIESGQTVLDIGHHAEKIFIPYIQEMIEEQFPELEVFASTVNTNPYISL